MLTALIKILELALAAARKTPDQKREQLAKTLYKVYADIDDVVLRGNKLMALFGSSQAVVANAAIDVLLEQQVALNSLAVHLREVEPILKIHLPFTATLHVAVEFKGDVILFILDWLLNSPNDQRGSEMPLPDRYSEMTGTVRRLFLSAHLSSEELTLEESRSDPLNPWELFYPEPINHRHEWSDEQRQQHPTILIATSEDFRRAQDTLNSVAAIGEELRAFLAEKSKPEDLL
jgi:hypothetical protein